MRSTTVEAELADLRRRVEDATTLARLGAASCRARAASSRKRLEITRRAVAEAGDTARRGDEARGWGEAVAKM